MNKEHFRFGKKYFNEILKLWNFKNFVHILTVDLLWSIPKTDESLNECTRV